MQKCSSIQRSSTCEMPHRHAHCSTDEDPNRHAHSSPEEVRVTILLLESYAKQAELERLILFPAWPSASSVFWGGIQQCHVSAIYEHRKQVNAAIQLSPQPVSFTSHCFYGDSSTDQGSQTDFSMHPAAVLVPMVPVPYFGPPSLADATTQANLHIGWCVGTQYDVDTSDIAVQSMFGDLSLREAECQVSPTMRDAGLQVCDTDLGISAEQAACAGSAVREEAVPLSLPASTMTSRTQRGLKCKARPKQASTSASSSTASFPPATSSFPPLPGCDVKSFLQHMGQLDHAARLLHIQILHQRGHISSDGFEQLKKAFKLIP